MRNNKNFDTFKKVLQVNTLSLKIDKMVLETRFAVPENRLRRDK